MPDGIKRPVSLQSQAFAVARIVPVDVPCGPTSGGLASRTEQTTGHRHELRDANGCAIATVYCSPEVAKAIAAAINAADPGAEGEMTNAEMDEAEEQAATQVFAERYGVSLSALTETFLRAAMFDEEHMRTTGEVMDCEAGVRAILAALGIEVRDDG